MCVGHPKRHPCQHTSVTYNHCVAAHFDGATRVTTPCHNTTYAAQIGTESKCTNQLCFFEELGGSWICCRCRNGPNYVGWCTFDNPRTEVNAITQQLEQVTKCDHCCCWNCTPYCELMDTCCNSGQTTETTDTLPLQLPRTKAAPVTVARQSVAARQSTSIKSRPSMAGPRVRDISGLRWITARKAALRDTRRGNIRRNREALQKATREPLLMGISKSVAGVGNNISGSMLQL
ncbi:hypothetical protein KVR01_010935 [Diaporthe batatas]|uniref:uncharacterized protein n=1 Tax=Diaporthe batatas TaxID=748121 RepID=UPI001D0513F6|nr:uncharacterized protein KVR01_010935 [Diaporthe batatas]KAG8159274.1 hypothetical protein KVR01_010935 [Diaporthe batatas]